MTMSITWSRIYRASAPICARIAIPKCRLAFFTNTTKDQALEETVLTFFDSVVYGCFQPIGVTIEDTIARHDVVKG